MYYQNVPPQNVKDFTMNTTYVNDDDYGIDENSNSDLFDLENLVQEINDVIEKGICLDNIPKLSFSPEHKGKFNPFGYDSMRNAKLEIPKTIYRRNKILHKLIRVQKEFQFADRNIKNYRELTHREKEIIQLLAKGNNNPEIAEKLFISRCTVEQHRKNINCKLKVRRFSNLMQYVYAFDLL